MTSVLLIGECDQNGEITQATLQAITAAKVLDDPIITAVFPGQPPESVKRLPIDSVVIASEVTDSDDGIFEQATADISSLLLAKKPDVILLSKSDLGSIVGARLAFRTDIAFVPDCLEISNSKGQLTVIRPVYGGSALAEFIVPSYPVVVTLRPGSYKPVDEDGMPSIDSIEFQNVEPSALVADTVAELREGIRLEEAKVVVSGGRGLGGPEPFSILENIADELGGAVGASRAACDAGWIDHSHQVGLTGKSVSPEVYIAVGISGASQHMAGCSSSRAIVAINTDPDSNIFREARFGVIGDWENVLPSFLDAVRELKA